MDLLNKSEEFARKKYKRNDSYHQWEHVEKVMERALKIARYYKHVDYEALRLAIIFHDIDYASYETPVDASIKLAEEFLMKNNYPQERIKKVKEIMMNHSGPHRRK